MIRDLHIVFHEDGSIRGIATYDHTAVAKKATVEELEALIPGINAVALLEVERLKEVLAAGPATLGISKLTLKRRLTALGKWTAFKSFLTSLGDDAADEFYMAAEIRLDDPAFAQLAPLAKDALSLTDEEFSALLQP